MRKIPSVFQAVRTPGGKSVTTGEVNPACQWVFDELVSPTRKFDGTACMIKDNQLFKRYDAKAGRTPPDGFFPCEPAPDAASGHWPGWVAVGPGPEDTHHREAFDWISERRHDGTYELIGPRIQGNPEAVEAHTLVPHGAHLLPLPRPYTFEGIKNFLAGQDVEGIVFYGEDGKMAKVKKRDLGLTRKPAPVEVPACLETAP